MKFQETRLQGWKFVIILITLLSSSHIFAEDLRNKASFAGRGWAGARYAALGNAAEILVDDVYAIYWNPAGLGELSRKGINADNENEGNTEELTTDNIEEEYLIHFSEDGRSDSFFQIGLSAAKLDNERESGFAGVAFNMLCGVMGVGLYYIQSKENEVSSSDGNSAGKTDASGSAGYISFGWDSGLYSFGFSIKGLHQGIGDIKYYGGGIDAGCMVEVIPFVRLGLVIQDIGTGLKTNKHYEDVNNSYDFISPVIKFSAAVTSSASDFILAIGGIKKLNGGKYELHIGIQYDVISRLSLYFGLNDSMFSTGFTCKLQHIEVSYAFSSDKIDSGYNNIISATCLFN